MAKIMLDILLVLLFIGIACLQVYVIFRIKQLKATYDEFMDSQSQFVHYIEKARQSLMLVSSQATDVLPELTKKIEESDSLMQDFSFVLARANKKIEVLQDMSSLNNSEIVFSDTQIEKSEPTFVENKVQTPMQAYQTMQEPTASREFEDDPVLARLEALERQDDLDSKKDDIDFLKSDNSRALQQQELIEKALKEIL